MSITNMEKYENYKEQFGRLKRSLANEFFLEAIFIEYAIIEDRTTSILRHAGVYNPEKHNKLVPKIRRIREIIKVKNRKELLKKYITDELLDDITLWKDQRNALIHDLLNQKVTKEQLKTCAEHGYEICKALRNKAGSYARALEKANNAEKEKLS